PAHWLLSLGAALAYAVPALAASRIGAERGRAALWVAWVLHAAVLAWGLLGTGDVRSFIQSGKLRAIGQLRQGRSELWPDVPTLTEQGVPGGVDFDVWFGIVAPAKTPAPIVRLLGEKIAKITAEPAFRQRLLDLGGVAPATDN
uniref:tripartite tricarboxylate transporter substrate-binding protein n=1 Tax=Raoultella sp. 18098 TaxID=2681430 RepID=UPI00210269FD